MPSSWYDLIMPPVNSLGWFAGINSPLKYPVRNMSVFQPAFYQYNCTVTILNCKTTYSLRPPHPPLTFWSSSLLFLLLLTDSLLTWLVAPSRILVYASSDDPEYIVCVCMRERGRERRGGITFYPCKLTWTNLPYMYFSYICIHWRSHVQLHTHTPGCPCSLRVCMCQNQPSSSSPFPSALLSPWHLVSCRLVFP